MVLRIAIVVAGLLASVPLFSKDLKTTYKKEGKLVTELINIDKLIKDGRITTRYIDTLRLFTLDSIHYENNNPDRSKVIGKEVALDFTQKQIKKGSPEYYALYTAYHINRCMEYFNSVFDGKIDFNSQAEYRSVKTIMGDVPPLSSPKEYIIMPNSAPSPSLFYHEIGHRAFWYIEDSMKVAFKGLSYIHTGLLEYFTVSLNNSPLIGEDFFPPTTYRDASKPTYYPFDESLKLRHTFRVIKEAYAKELANPQSNIARYIKVSMSYEGDILDKYYDNHRTGMIVTSTLWRIRQKIGQAKMDKIVAKAVLMLNEMMAQRASFYTPEKDEKVPSKIEWYDLVHGLIKADEALNKGAAHDIIKDEFKNSHFPIERIKG